jgi:hypothetical protein
MSIATLILGASGTGKSASLRNLDPTKTLIIQAVRKPFPFKNNGSWSYRCKDTNPNGNVFSTDDSSLIVKIIHASTAEVIVIDDFQYTMSNDFMRTVLDKATKGDAYDRFNRIGHGAWSIFRAASDAADWKRVYILSHTEQDIDGRAKIKTIGRLVDEKIVLEGLVTTCLQTAVINGQYKFITQNDGSTNVKSPMGLFDDLHIENDLAAVDGAICAYYGIKKNEQQQ